jgi:hypothetical protein
MKIGLFERIYCKNEEKGQKLGEKVISSDEMLSQSSKICDFLTVFEENTFINLHN